MHEKEQINTHVDVLITGHGQKVMNAALIWMHAALTYNTIYIIQYYTIKSVTKISIKS